MLEFRILGPLEVVGDHGSVRLGGPKQRATLAILLLNANRVVSVERLADDLYAGDAPVTAVTQVQRQISDLRRALGSASVIETRAPGYAIRFSPEQLDLNRFERLVDEAGRALDRGEAQVAADVLGDALALWRGAPLADLAYESFARSAIARLEEIRLAALERRIEADLLLGRHAELVGELDALIVEHPLRERLRAQMMLALFRSGRQAEALEVYRRTRELLVAEFGIEPTPGLQQLERAILTQDPSLALRRPGVPGADPERTLLVVPSDGDRIDALLTVVEPLARLPARQVIVARLLADVNDLEGESGRLSARRASLGSAMRTAAFTTLDPGRDAVRLASAYDVELVLLDAAQDLDGPRLPKELATILAECPADVAVLVGPDVDWGAGLGVFVPFGGGENDWAALEVGSWLASAAGAPVRLVGTKADLRLGRRDASRLLADASLAAQRVIGVAIDPLLAAPTEDGLVAAVEQSTVVVAGISPRWREEGIGSVRRALVRRVGRPIVLVHRGPRPSGLAPHGGRTRFTWSIEAPAA